jgi:hypothetical protein
LDIAAPCDSVNSEASWDSGSTSITIAAIAKLKSSRSGCSLRASWQHLCGKAAGGWGERNLHPSLHRRAMVTTCSR